MSSPVVPLYAQVGFTGNGTENFGQGFWSPLILKITCQQLKGGHSPSESFIYF